MNLQNKSDLESYLDSREGSRLMPLLADLNIQNDMINEAIELCRKIILDDPRSPYGYYLLALAEVKSGEIDHAIEHLKQTVDLDNGFLDAYHLLIEIGRDKLPPGVLKACYEKIHFLNPLDDAAVTESGHISENADYEGLRDIRLPEIIIHKTASRTPAGEKPEIAESEAEPTSEQPALSEEEAHLGPMIPEDEETEPYSGEEPEEIKSVESEAVSAEPADFDSEPEPESEPQAKAEAEPEPSLSPQPKEEPSSEPAPSPPELPESEKEQAAPSQLSGATPSAINEMFSKLKTKPLAEVQKENWTLPVVEAPEPPPKEDEPLRKPNVKYTVPLKEESDSKKKPEEIQKEIGFTGATNKDEQKKEDVKPLSRAPETQTEGKKISESQKTSPKPSGIKSNGSKVELKIPVPTFTLVEVFKKQKLYDEALQLLDVLEKKSKNPARIEKERAKIIKLKMEEE